VTSEEDGKAAATRIGQYLIGFDKKERVSLDTL
jgi:hypothetical protein